MRWAAEHRYPYLMLATRLEPTKLSFDYYREVARVNGYEAGPSTSATSSRSTSDETEELAYDTGKKFLEGPGNIFLEGSRGTGLTGAAEPARPDRPSQPAAGPVSSGSSPRHGDDDATQVASDQAAEESGP